MQGYNDKKTRRRRQEKYFPIELKNAYFIRKLTQVIVGVYDLQTKVFNIYHV